MAIDHTAGTQPSSACSICSDAPRVRARGVQPISVKRNIRRSDAVVRSVLDLPALHHLLSCPIIAGTTSEECDERIVTLIIPSTSLTEASKMSTRGSPPSWIPRTIPSFRKT
jgi:hypothetical protein